MGMLPLTHLVGDGLQVSKLRVKNYLARASNINKFTGGRYKHIHLNENAEPIYDEKVHEIQSLQFPDSQVKRAGAVLICDSDLSNFKVCNNYKEVLVLELNNDNRKIKLSQPVLNFKSNILRNFQKRVDGAYLVDSSDIGSIFSQRDQIDVLYPCVGENYDFLKRSSAHHQCRLHFRLRSEDIYSWQFAKKGFFNFKKSIPDILRMLSLA